MKNHDAPFRISFLPVTILLFFFVINVYGFSGSADLIITLKDRYQNDWSFEGIREDYLLSSKYDKLIHGIMPVRLPGTMSMEVAVDLLRSDNRIAHVESDYIVHTTELPNDPFFHLQWSLHNPGNTRADIKAVEAWRLHRGNRKIIIAILDTGINYKHPDLVHNMWTNPGEIPGNNTDDDENGFVDDIHGWDFAYDTKDPDDRNFHGTHVAGIIGAVTNNSFGVAGIMHHVSLMAVKGIQDAGWGFSSDLIAGIYYAVDNGALIINASWGGGGYLEAMIDALDYAREHNVIFVGAAGNYRGNNDEVPYYPASYAGDNIVSVGASSSLDSIALLSQYGRYSVELFAPGVSILSTGLGQSFRYGSGTSMATPHVAAGLGLLLAADPSLHFSRCIDILLSSVEKKQHMTDYCVSGGRLDVYRALRQVAPSIAGGYAPVDLKKKVMVVTRILEMLENKKEEH